MKKIVIGLTGRLASGKGTVAKHLVAIYGADKTRSSDPLRQTLDIYDIPQTREHLDALSTFVRRTYGEDIIAKAVKRYLSHSSAEVVIFDGLRRLVDIEVIRSFEHSLFIYVDAQQRTRHTRSVGRNENVGDDTMTLDEFIAKDSEEPQQQIEALKEYADIVLDNNGSPEQLKRQLEKNVDTFIEKLIL
ncbi:AAA family ATPase [Candidatus Uhrbacteria bacterium]|nr:AAA family ATPase [Candidatus Uhrbacteria bacterium]